MMQAIYELGKLKRWGTPGKGEVVMSTSLIDEGTQKVIDKLRADADERERQEKKKKKRKGIKPCLMRRIFKRAKPVCKR
jgi:hypothetical protein